MELTGELSAYDIAYNRLIVHGWATYTDSSYIREVLKAMQTVCNDNAHENYTGPLCARVVIEWAQRQREHAQECIGREPMAHIVRAECALSLLELAKLLK